MRIIDNQKNFNTLCAELKKEKRLFIDTEFCRRRTYHAILSVIQIATEHDEVIIDVLSGINISGIKNILIDKDILKVFHSPDQDFGIFLYLFGELPKNVFDTQIAASVVGFNELIGYGKLCKELLHINLDKTMQKANWMARPLTKELINYAINDVKYLIPIYRELNKSINDRNLWDNYNVKSEKFLDKKHYIAQPKKILQRMNLQNYTDSFAEKLLYFVELREECVKVLDIPRKFGASDYDLIELCKTLPTDNRALKKLQISYKPMAKNKYREKLLSLCNALREF